MDKQARIYELEATVARLTEERDNHRQVALDHANQPVLVRDYQNVCEAVVYEHNRAEQAEARATAAETELQALRDELHDAELVLETLTGHKVPPREAVSGPSDTPKE